MEIWLRDFTLEDSPGKLLLLQSLEKRKFIINKWSPLTPGEIGLIFIHTDSIDEQLLNFLRANAGQKGNKVVVINFSPVAFTVAGQLSLLESGAGYVFSFSQIEPTLYCIADKLERWRNINSMIHSPLVKNFIVGSSYRLKKILQEIIEVTLYANVPVLICGERGTGKELIARLVHEFDGRKDKGNFVVLDCTTLKKELSGSELFGHEKGSFTGADNSREGAFSLANNGTLFLDEIGELPLNLQSELLRVIQEGTYKKTGSNIWKQTSFKLVSATNKNLEEESVNGNFRTDLYDRISAYKCTMPPLSERKEDIPGLVNFFLKTQLKVVPEIDNPVLDFLCERNYPGNIRELKNIVSRICLHYTGSGPVTLGDIMWYDTAATDELKLPWYEKKEFIKIISKALEEGYDLKKIEEIVKDITMKTALTIYGKNKLVSEALGVSDRWVQQRRKLHNNPTT